MIISHKYKFIFIKTRKTAGTSIEAFLSKQCGDEDVVTPVYPPIDGHKPRNYRGLFNPVADLGYYSAGRWPKVAGDLLQRQRFSRHIPALLVRSRVSAEIWNTYTKFCVDRDPIDKTLSHYYMLRMRGDGTMTIDDYFRRGRYCLNYRHYTDSQNRIIVDHVLRYENLDAELTRIFGLLGVPFSGQLLERAKSDATETRVDYRTVLTGQQIEVIEQVFAEEVAILTRQEQAGV